jgi:hypothetical protein
VENKKKPPGMKHKIREEKKREERIGLAVTVIVLIAIVSVSGFFINSMLSSSPQTEEASSTSELRAAIVDQLSLTYPNQTFIEKATNTLKQAGFTVDYYPGREVTVELYRNLPTRGYSIIILRVHSALAYSEEGQKLGFVDLFSSEPYNTNKYVYEQLTDQISKVMFLNGESAYFGISPPFIAKSMSGRFNNTLIIMMGCDGLTYTSLARAFVDKGAKAYISWKGRVSASHTDKATTRLLQYLIAEKNSIKKAVEATMDEVGSDPAYESLLTYYPYEAGEYTIQKNLGA